MLGRLRRELGRRQIPTFAVEEVPQEVTRLSAAALHDLLADAGLLPPRPRLPPPGHQIQV
jgi:hypothetical protein